MHLGFCDKGQLVSYGTSIAGDQHDDPPLSRTWSRVVSQVNPLFVTGRDKIIARSFVDRRVGMSKPDVNSSLHSASDSAS